LVVYTFDKSLFIDWLSGSDITFSRMCLVRQIPCHRIDIPQALFVV